MGRAFFHRLFTIIILTAWFSLLPTRLKGKASLSHHWSGEGRKEKPKKEVASPLHELQNGSPEIREDVSHDATLCDVPSDQFVISQGPCENNNIEIEVVSIASKRKEYELGEVMEDGEAVALLPPEPAGVRLMRGEAMVLPPKEPVGVEGGSG